MDDRIELAKCIEDEFKEEFRIVHLAKNLVNTMKIEVQDNNVIIDIPAMKYNMKKFRETGVVKYYYRGSYAQQINITGGLSGKHEDYVEKCIERGIQKWLAQKGVSGKVSISE